MTAKEIAFNVLYDRFSVLLDKARAAGDKDTIKAAKELIQELIEEYEK